MKTILVGSPEVAAVQVICSTLGPEYQITSAPRREEFFRAVRDSHFELILADVEFLFRNGRADRSLYHLGDALTELRNQNPDGQIIVLTPPDLTPPTLQAVTMGASHYLVYPVYPDDLRLIRDGLEKSIRVKTELDYLRDRFWQIDALDFIHTRSPLMREIYAKVRAVAPTRAAVLLTGETGTGKGVIARLIHSHSPRGGNPFLSVHCGAIPETLLESELFGHEKGAFSGAFRRKLGKFEMARTGTIFLDEIGTVSVATQIKLLQVLQEKKFERVGGEETIEADVRVIAATNEELERRCAEGSFRRDLFYRLNVFPIEVPPLRARREDIPILASIFLKRLNSSDTKNIEGVHPQVLEAFERYPWPGNIRELENLIERAYILETGRILTPQCFPGELFGTASPSCPGCTAFQGSLADVRRQGMEEIERNYLQNLLQQHHGYLQEVARSAGIGVRQLHKLMTRHNLHKEDFRCRRNAS